ncbi:AsmA family protein [Rheinheimera sp.]|uniref:AsmA family protein n=1 Tax=Rheinheimera sp. TaxID=1869214 RepID=UPI003AF6B20A
MKLAIKLVAALVLLIGALVLLLPQFLSSEKIWAEVSSQVEQQTGRRIQVEGTPELSLFPALGLQLKGLKFANQPGSKVSQMLTAEQLTLRLAWSSLWSGTVRIDEFVLEKPELYLEKNSKGQANWQLLAGDKQPAAAAAGSAPSSAAALPDLQLGDIRIVDGKLSYQDAQTGSAQQLDNLQLSIEIASLKSPLRLQGEADYRGKTQKLDLSVDHLAALLAKEPISLQLELDNDLLALKLDANYQTNLQGKLELEAGSLRELLAWFDVQTQASPEVMNKLELKSTVLLTDNDLQLTGLSMALDQLKLTGEQRVQFLQPVKVSGQLALNTLDLNPYLGLHPQQESTAAAAATQDWDQTPLDLSALTHLNLDQQLKLAGLVFQQIKLGPSEMKLVLNNGKARFDLAKLDAYQGKGSAWLELNAASKPYQMASQFNLTGVAAQPLLTDAAGFDKLLGTGQVSGQLASSGLHQKALVEALNGTVSFRFADGAIRGANIAAIVRSAGQALQGNLQAVNLDKDFSESEKTDFSELSASMQFAAGIGQSSDLHLASPLLRLTGNGSLDLPKRQVDYLLSPSLVASIEGQGATEAGKGLTIPVRVKGPWTAIKIRPDISQTAKDKAKQKIEDKVKDKLKGLLGGG